MQPSPTRTSLPDVNAQERFPAALQWLLVPVGALAGFAAGWLTFAALVWAGRVVLSHATFEHLIPIEYYAGSAGAFAACGTVLGGALVAPKRRSIAAIVVFFAGATAAWLLLGHWLFPEGHSRAYQTSLVPFIGTCVGGLAGVALVSTRFNRPSRSHGGTA